MMYIVEYCNIFVAQIGFSDTLGRLVMTAVISVLNCQHYFDR